MSVDEKAFQAFMQAHHENGGTGLGFRKSLEAYEAAKTADQPGVCSKHGTSWHGNCPECNIANPKIEPCPFCGHTPEIKGDRASIECSNAKCLVSPGSSNFTLPIAIAAWNRRAPKCESGDDKKDVL